MGRVLLFALAWSVAGMWGAAAADACSVAAPSPGQKAPKPTLRNVDAGVFGKVVTISERSPTVYRATLRVRRVYKGRIARTIHIRYTTDGGACGTSFSEGAVVGLRLFRPSPFYVNKFSRVSLRYLNRATDGRWHRPQDR